MVVTVWLLFGRNQPADEAFDTTPEYLPAVQKSSFQNTEPGVDYVGAASCADCHPEIHAAYSQTGHSRALAEVDLAIEPPDGELTDPHSQKSYRIYRQDGRLHHEESIRTVSGEQLVLSDFPARYTIGSGRFSRSYLIELDGFLYESPATWYTARPGWGLSPGYEHYNPGFQRPAELRCLTCHAGRVETVANSPQRVRLHALAIDCERCHGPGAIHVAKRESSNESIPEGERDDSIVNPRLLDRRLREDICAQCHLHSAATVELKNRRLQDFRPGLRLKDFVTHFGIQTPKQQMEVVGHVEQLRLSRCYQQSDSLTCTTCHHPHAQSAEGIKEISHRDRCLTCHTEQACGASIEIRRADNLADNCIACHMPRGDTEIPHFAFTHHRIGIHRPAEPQPTDESASQLVALEDVSWQPKLDQNRNLGLAYLQFSLAAGQSAHAASHLQQAMTLLTNVQRQVSGDPEVEAALARLYWGRDPQLTLRHAHLAADAENASPEAAATACFTLGSTFYEQGELAMARSWLERTVQLRPTADVWIMLSNCYEQSGDLTPALEAAQRGAQLASDRPRYVQRSAELLLKAGRVDEANSIGSRVMPLRHYRQIVDQ
jgi:Tfp pilus assembly protein PilF